MAPGARASARGVCAHRLPGEGDDTGARSARILLLREPREHGRAHFGDGVRQEGADLLLTQAPPPPRTHPDVQPVLDAAEARGQFRTLPLLEQELVRDRVHPATGRGGRAGRGPDEGREFIRERQRVGELHERACESAGTPGASMPARRGRANDAPRKLRREREADRHVR